MVLFMGDVLEDTEQQIFIVMFVARLNFLCSVYLLLQIKYFLGFSYKTGFFEYEYKFAVLYPCMVTTTTYTKQPKTAFSYN